KYLRVLHDKYSNNIIIVYEPNMDAVKNQFSECDFQSMKNVMFVYGENSERDLLYLIQNCINYINVRFVKEACVPNYVNMYTDDYSTYKNTISFGLRNIYLNRNTAIVDEDIRGRGVLYNCGILKEITSYSRLINVFLEENLKDYPAVVVAAGPSLDKNVKELKGYEGKAFIICCDGAIKTLIKNGITPDMTICLDPEKNPLLFDNEIIEKLPICITPEVNYKVNRIVSGRKFMIGTGNNGLIDEVFKGYDMELYYAPTGGSVATTAFSAVVALGFGTVILVGQDLAYTDKKTHTESYDKDYDPDKLMQKEDNEYVEDVFGNPVLTSLQLIVYKSWFEKQIKMYPNLTVIDATEGGAKIEGSRIMSLKEALEKAKDNEPIDFKKMIEDTPYSFNKETGEKIEKYVTDAIQSVPKLKDEIKRELLVYDDLDRCIKNSFFDSKRIKKLLTRVNNYLTKLKNNPASSIIDKFEIGADYDIMNELATEELSGKDEMKGEVELISKTGRKTLERYLAAADKMMEQWHIVWDE
ncbi:MAG: DUF115 domain-containing protein, partial [Lachnospiraceae bacterium]|nr:DUF115 domain-containing protein [Lachnospiraceae bacterium]